jgi:predicted AAA+ superfamily ATPase
LFVKRELESVFKKLQNIYPVIALVGPRQAGKTTFVKEALVSEKNYLLFDDPDVREIFDTDIKSFEKQYLHKAEVSILDEVHVAKEPGQKLKYLADSGYKIWVTASSELLLSHEVLSFLVGRVSVLRLFPFNFTEYLTANNIYALTDQILLRETTEHIRYGGYPKVVTTTDLSLKKIILRDLYETMILKDIAKTFNLLDFSAIEKLTAYFAINTGGQVTIESLAQNVGVSSPTIKKYLEAMEKSYLLHLVKPFYNNKTKELTKQPKVYFMDTGLRNSIRNNFNEDGPGFENYVLTELVRHGFKPKYWRTKTKLEIDFVIEIGDTVIPVEVKISESRIGSSFKSFINEYKPEIGYIVVLRGESINLEYEGCNIYFVKTNQLINNLLTLNKE